MKLKKKMTNNLNADFALKYINSAMNLRKPQLKSLELFANYLKSQIGQKMLSRLKNQGSQDNQKLVQEILAESINYFSQISETKNFAEFERKFPAFTFALATGVGKTRLMGAFVAYLYLVYGIQHFLIVAPNLTIYRKLFTDFSKANHPKYVFRGIQEINSTTARIITTNNYENESGKQLFGNQLEINIFNIQQFAQKDRTQQRGIHGFKENIGESYFDYLKSQSDLVVMLDEAHHYHADAALESLDVLDPLFALEMTATPYLGTKGSGKNARQIIMQNVLYSYNLGDAIRGKLVKNPWIGTETDLDFSKFDFDSIEGDSRKLQLAAFFHQRAKIALEEYALENNLKIIKPVLLVVAKDTNHASELKNLLDSDNFRGGEFKGKVLEIHTKVKGEEAEGNIEQLISLEDEGNLVEVVIHVNMLKEGWDVANVYTIAPLRQSAAAILTEQTIGRGLRLPYGERTGNELVDKLVIVAHEQYSKILEMAKDSVLIQGQIEQINPQEIGEKKVLIQSLPIVVKEMATEIEKSAATMASIEIEVKKEVLKNPQNANFSEEKQQEIIATKTKDKVLDLAREIISHDQQSVKNLPLFDYNSEAKSEINKIAADFYEKPKTHYIAIPRLDLRPSFSELAIHDFDLDETRMRFYQNYRNIIEEQLQNDLEKNLLNEEVFSTKDKQTTKINSFGSLSSQAPQNTIIAALCGFDVIDYEDKNQKPLLLKLANQAVNHYRKKSTNEENLALIVESNIYTIAEDIYKQISENLEYKSPSYLKSEIGKPKSLADHNIATIAENCVSLQSQLDSFSAKFIYENFKKACHEKYRFDSSDEVRFTYLLENDDSVKCWLRPSPKQFEGLFYRKEPENILSNYEPDFVVELVNEIILVEVKPENEIADLNVVAKKQTAEKYCELISQNIGKFEIIKPWRYVIVPTNRIKITATIGALLGGNK
jgi:type III restriction enzyme